LNPDPETNPDPQPCFKGTGRPYRDEIIQYHAGLYVVHKQELPFEIITGDTSTPRQLK
jgi:hypothetical protein